MSNKTAAQIWKENKIKEDPEYFRRKGREYYKRNIEDNPNFYREKYKGRPEYNHNYSKKRYAKNKSDPIWVEKNKKYMRDYYRRYREIVIKHYGGKCVCCGEDTMEFLALDHIDGGGNEQRKKAKIKNTSYQLFKQGFPPGIQILCHNCNSAKGFYGKCPHEK